MCGAQEGRSSSIRPARTAGDTEACRRASSPASGERISPSTLPRSSASASVTAGSGPGSSPAAGKPPSSTTRPKPWNGPTRRWTKVNQDRQAETDAGARLAAIDTRLDRSALRGGPRTEERAQLQVEAVQLRSAHPALATGANRAPVWDARADKAWADDKATVDRFRGDATTLRGKAEQVSTTLDPLAEQRRGAQVRLDQLLDEGRRRQGQRPRPPASRSTETGRDRTGPGLQPAPGGSLQPAGAAGANRRIPGRAAPPPDVGETPAPQHTPGVDPSQPARPPSRGTQR